MKAVLAGAVYAALVFALGFALGALRELVLRPMLGAGTAFAIEAPVMIAASLLICFWLVRRMKVAGRVGDRLVMGLVYFVLLQAAEVLLAFGLRGWTFADYLAAFGSTVGALGLAAQAVTAFFPLIVPRR